MKCGTKHAVTIKSFHTEEIYKEIKVWFVFNALYNISPGIGDKPIFMFPLSLHYNGCSDPGRILQEICAWFVFNVHLLSCNFFRELEKRDIS